MRYSILLIAGALLLATGVPVLAQDAAAPVQENQSPAVLKAEEEQCDGCPPRRIGHSFLQVTGVNVIYEIGNLARGQVTARITPKTWWANMQQGWVWDLDDFAVNQIGHPY